MGIYAGFLTHLRTKTWVFHTPWMSWGVWKTPTFENCLEKIGCVNPHVEKSFFYVLLYFAKMISFNMTLDQIFWFNSSSAMVLKFINWRKNLNWGLMQNVSSVAISVWQLLFLHSIPDKQKTWKFIWIKSDFWLHWTVSANFISKYTLNIARGTTDPGYCLFNLSYLLS